MSLQRPPAAVPAVHEDLFTREPSALRGGRCAPCAALHFPIRAICPACQADEIEAVALSTAGRVHTFTIVRMPPPGYLGETPYAYGVVELPEGLRVTTTLLAADLEAIAIGDACAFELLPLGDAERRVLSFAYRVTEESA
jgi:uncharacterized OB-fold protein